MVEHRFRRLAGESVDLVDGWFCVVEIDQGMVKRVIKTVIFDLGKVLIPFDFSRGYRAMEKLCNYPAAEIPRRIASTDVVHRFEMWSCIFLPHTLVPESVLEGLRRRYRLLVLSNTNAIHFAMVRQSYPMLRHFDDFVLSYEVKAMKPAPAIYREAIARAQCRAEECFYTDDIAEYVEGARKEGIDAVQFVSGEQLERDLAARDIRWS
jgi:putative hydrolase of the HAD superfamily